MTIKYINIFQYKELQNLPKTGIFGLKINYLATLPETLQTKTLRQPFLKPKNRYFFHWFRPLQWKVRQVKTHETISDPNETVL
jgi:hypothetical protein